MFGLLIWLVSMAAVPAAASGELAPLCTVEIRGVPKSLLVQQRIEIEGATRPAASSISITVPGASRRVSLSGPRYTGRIEVRREQCMSGATLVLDAKPLPAQLEFECAPPGTTIECRRCPGAAGERLYLATEFPRIAMKEHEREVTMLLRAPGFRRATRRFVIRPGPNELHIHLEPLGS